MVVVQTVINNLIQKEIIISLWRLCLCSSMMHPLLKQIFAAVGTLASIFMHGSFIGLQSLVIPNLRDVNSPIKLTVEQESWVLSSRVFLTLPTLFLSGLLMERFGRKVVVVLSTIPLIVTFTMIYFAKDFVTLMMASVISGLSAAGPEVGSMMVGEITSPKYRGAILNCKSIAFASGLMVTHFLGNYYSYCDLMLPYLIPGVISLVCSILIPESPVWLASRGRFKESKKAFRWFRGDEENTEIDQLISTYTETRKNNQPQQTHLGCMAKINNTLKFLANKTFLRACLIICIFTVMFETSGRLTLTLFAVDLLSDISGNKNNIYFYLAALDSLDIVAFIISVYLIKRFPKRPLIFSTSIPGICFLFTFCLFTYFTAHDIVSKQYSWISIAFLGAYFFFLNLGLMPCRFTMLSEIFPLAYRGAGISASSVISVVCQFVISMITPHLFKSLGIHGTYFMNGLLTFVTILSLYGLLPETRDKTLQEIEADMSQKSPKYYTRVRTFIKNRTDKV